MAHMVLLEIVNAIVILAAAETEASIEVGDMVVEEEVVDSVEEVSLLFLRFVNC